MGTRYLTSKRINPEDYVQKEVTNSSGVSVVYFDTVSKNPYGKEKDDVNVVADEQQAETMIDDIIEASYRKWPVVDVKLQQRIGSIKAGEISMVIDVCASDREVAYRVSEFLIESLKKKAPIWQKAA